MPLNRDNMSRPQRLLLPAWPLFSVGMVIRCLTERDIPGAVTVGDFMPLHTWAVVFAAAALLMVVAAYRHDRSLFELGLSAVAVSMSIWAIALFLAPIFTSHYAGAHWVWPAMLGWVAYVQIESLETTREEP